MEVTSLVSVEDGKQTAIQLAVRLSLLSADVEIDAQRTSSRKLAVCMLQ